MIPLKLQIKNFLSYGADAQTIDFEPYHMICLSGKNGHGKSALLDALTWALWGHARKITGVAKADEGLLRLGQQQMVVVLSFLCNGQRYQVRREYTKGNYNKSYVNLDFGVFDEEKQGFVPVGGKSVRSAQAAIDDVVRLDFDSFCNSAFLRQGQSNEFSKKSPKERKEVLGSILGIGQYEAIRKLASEKMREVMSERIALQALVERTKQELQTVATIETGLQLVMEQWAEQNQEERGYGIYKKDLQQQLLTVIDERRNQQQLLVRNDEIRKKKDALRQSISELAKQWRQIHRAQLSCAFQENSEEKRRQLLDELNKLQIMMQQGLSVRERLLEHKKLYHEREQLVLRAQEQFIQKQQIVVEMVIMEQRMSMEKREQVDARIKHFSKEKKELETERDGIQKEIAVQGQFSTQLEKIQQQFEKRKACYQQMITQGNLLQHELENLEHKKMLSDDDANPSCPLCEQNLSASRRRFLRQKFSKDEQFLRHRLARITKVVQSLKELLIEQHKEIIRIQKSIDGKKESELKYQELNKRLARMLEDLGQLFQQTGLYEKELEQTKIRLASEQEKLRLLHESMRVLVLDDRECLMLRQALQELENELAKHSDDARHLQEVHKLLQLHEQQMNKYQELQKQVALQDQRRLDITQLAQEYKKQCKEELSFLVVQQQLEQLAEQVKTLEQKDQELETQLSALMRRKEMLLQEKGSLENQRKKLGELDVEYRAQQKRLQEIEEQLDNLQAIIAATGKDGIQALLIQDVLPEIETEANALIAKLTDNQAQIFIESLRDLKKGGTKETLDINISDGLGIRPYEMFSGGEAFRIDFALRIAISKLLARRAGTSLQTLIIDEGFGSQDEDGLALIMDALYKIQDDFAKVIIVSHLPSMKDQFPVQFYVEKKATGSAVEAIEQG